MTTQLKIVKLTTSNWFHLGPIFYRSPVAQLVEQLTVNQLVTGSSPVRGAISRFDISTSSSSNCALRSSMHHMCASGAQACFLRICTNLKARNEEKRFWTRTFGRAHVEASPAGRILSLECWVAPSLQGLHHLLRRQALLETQPCLHLNERGRWCMTKALVL